MPPHRQCFNVGSNTINLMTDEVFLNILNNPESSILDFKADLYDFSNDKDNSVLAKFIKDVISFSNTIREGAAYIIFGVKENSDNTKEKVGITKNIDDGIFQDKIKNKLYPLPKISYYTKKLDGLTFGILEFSIKKYEFPITSTVKLRGVEVGKAYYRQGSTNTEALTLDIIKINSWLLSLPEIDFHESKQTLLSDFLKRLLTQKENLSEILPDIYVFAKSNNLTELKEFCEFEIKGIDVANDEVREKIHNENERYKYRVMTIKVSLDKIAQTFHRTPEQLKQELSALKNFFDIPYFFKESIPAIETCLKKTDGFMTTTMGVKDFFPDYKENYPVYGYIFNSDLTSLYQNIRQNLIDLIMNSK